MSHHMKCWPLFCDEIVSENRNHIDKSQGFGLIADEMATQPWCLFDQKRIITCMDH